GAIGANRAAKKGILVVNSAGNEGDKTWKYIVTPADGDSVLAVAAVTATGAVANFSSYGPSSDGQIKPDVASVGVATIVQFPNNTIGSNNGTSFACPNIAGLASCLWQGFPEFNNMKIINALRQAGSKASSPDDRVGYGIPDVKKALVNLVKDFSTASASVSNCTVSLQWTSKDVSSMKYEIERTTPGQTGFLKIAEQQGTGTIFSTRSPYQFQDVLSGVEKGTVTYRIKQIVDTSKAGFTFAYIDTVTINLQAVCIDAGLVDVTLFGNPAKDQFTVRVTTPTASSNIAIRIFSANGQLLSNLNKPKLAGTAFFENISLLKFSKGIYYVSVYDNDKLIGTRELIKL
ncbi:MAG: S8 family peptidase, partial [Flavisolibacter sp.]|nr:S8 family peptidase [Flavisolibacter sp.]